MTRKSGRNTDGTFAAGNPGKPKGTRHRATLAVERLLEGEAEALTRRAIEMAMEGDATALRLCIERIAPKRKDAPIHFALPEMITAGDTAKAAGAVLSAVSDGNLSPSEGAQMMTLVDAYRRALEIADLERRLSALEAMR